MARETVSCRWTRERKCLLAVVVVHSWADQSESVGPGRPQPCPGCSARCGDDQFADVCRRSLAQRLVSQEQTTPCYVVPLGQFKAPTIEGDKYAKPNSRHYSPASNRNESIGQKRLTGALVSISFRSRSLRPSDGAMGHHQRCFAEKLLLPKGAIKQI